MVRVLVGTVVGQYVAIEVGVEFAVDVISALKKALNKGGDDVSDAIRMIQYFDAFYSIMQKKFKEYLTPRKNVGDLIRGNVLIDRIKLIKKNSGRYVFIVFDKSISKEVLVGTLISLGYEVGEL